MANTDDERIVMEIEARLAEDVDGTLRSAVAGRIDAQLEEIETALRKGLPPDEYARLNAIKSGLDSARLILVNAWSHFHR